MQLHIISFCTKPNWSEPLLLDKNESLMKGVISMSGRKIYSTELKLEIVERYLKGDIGIKKLAQEYHVSYGDIQKWRDAFHPP